MRLNRLPGAGADLLRFLRAVRRRQITVVFGSTWVVIMAGALALAAVAVAGGRAWPASGAPAFQPSGAWTSLGILGLVVTALAATWTCVRRPTLHGAAKLVDGSLGLGALAVTALECYPERTAGSVPVRAMFEELNERLTESSPADVVRPRPRRWFAVLPLASGMLALAAIAPLERLSSPVANDNSSQASPEVVRSNLELLAAVLEDAGQEEDAVFGAFAPALLEISEQVSASGLVDKAVAERLSRILGSMAREAAASTSSTAKALTAAFEAAERGQDVLDEQDRPFRFGSDEAAAGPEGETAVETQQAVSKSPAFDPASVFRTLGEVASSLERNAGDPTAAAGGQQEAADANTGQSSTTGYYTDWDEEMATAQAAKRAAIRQRGRGETVAGEANQSDDSAGDAAGGGTQPLDSGAVETSANTLGSATDEFAIAADIREGGNTSTYLPEPEQGGSDEAGMDTVLRDSLMPGREIPVSIESIVTGDRDVIAAYFGRGSSNGSQGGTR